MSSAQTTLRGCLLAIMGLMLSTWASAANLSEPQKIEALIAQIAALKGAEFIRNGEAHSAPEAAEHLRMKWKKAGKRVQNADDFIRLVASQSYLTGKPYQIRMANGEVVAAGPWLRKALARL